MFHIKAIVWLYTNITAMKRMMKAAAHAAASSKRRKKESTRGAESSRAKSGVPNLLKDQLQVG